MRISCNSGYYSARPNADRYDMIEETVDFLANTGFEAIDVNFCATLYKTDGKKVHEPILDGDEEVRKQKLDRLIEKCRERNLPIVTSHLPFFSYTKLKGEEFDEAQDWVYRSLRAAEYIGAEWTVVHMARTAEETLPYVRGLCEYIRDEMPGARIGLAVENTPRSTIEELCRVVDTLDAEGFRVGVCFDVGHCNYAGLDCAETVRVLGKRIKMLHVHDNYGDRDAHQAPYAGSIPWDEFMTALAEIGYAGEFNYEITASRLPESTREAYARYCVALARELIGIYRKAKG